MAVLYILFYTYWSVLVYMILCFGYCNNGEIADLILILNGAFPKENTVVLKMFNKVNSAVRQVCKSQFERNYTCVCLNQSKYTMVEEATMMMVVVIVEVMWIVKVKARSYFVGNTYVIVS